MLRRLDDDQVDAIRCEPVASREPAHPLCRVGGTEDDVLKPLLTMQVWSQLRSFAESLASAWGAAHNGWGFEYDSDDRDECDEPFSGVRVFVPWDEVVVGTEPFERLMARYYAAILESTRQQRSPVMDEPWWPELEAQVAALLERVAARHAPPA